MNLNLIFLFLLSFGLRPSNAAYLICYEGSADNYINVSLSNATELLESSCIDCNSKTILFTFGYTGQVNGDTTKLVRDTYLSLGYNLILLDWEKEASDHGLLGLGYFIDTGIVPALGKKVGDAMTDLFDGGLDLASFQLIGLSLGAHVMGNAARRLKANGYKLPWVTGLDPAGPAYEGIASLKHIDKSCGNFVEIVHADEGRYGTVEAIGHVDYWPNYHTRVTTGEQPGCPKNITAFCSHDRAWAYYTEAVKRESAFPGSWAKNYKDWATAHGESDNVLYMAQVPSARYKQGNYYMTTNNSSLYGKGRDGLKPE